MEWNDTRTEYPRDSASTSCSRTQARAAPDAVAVVFEDRQLTYGELNARANQLAHHLRGLGVGPEVLVGLCVERSPEMVVGLLGILKAGGAYVPLDPAYPPSGWPSCCEDTRAAVLLTQERAAGSAAGVRGASCLPGPGLGPRSRAESPRTSATGATAASDLAYVIYTSGSTGQPKGVVIRTRPSTTCVQHGLRAAGTGRPRGRRRPRRRSTQSRLGDLGSRWCTGPVSWAVPTEVDPGAV